MRIVPLVRVLVLVSPNLNSENNLPVSEKKVSSPDFEISKAQLKFKTLILASAVSKSIAAYNGTLRKMSNKEVRMGRHLVVQ